MKKHFEKVDKSAGIDYVIYGTGTGIFSGLTIAIVFNNPFYILPVIGTGMVVGFAKCSIQNKKALDDFLSENQHLIK